jgi:hypothetical protein
VAGLIAKKIQAPQRGAWNRDRGEGLIPGMFFECVRADDCDAAAMPRREQPIMTSDHA